MVLVRLDLEPFAVGLRIHTLETGLGETGRQPAWECLAGLKFMAFPEELISAIMQNPRGKQAL